jgi:hypothetical protein
MRVLLTSAVLVAAGLFSYALSPGRVAAQGSQFPQAGITSGEKIRVWLDVDRTAYDCTVIEVRGELLGCRASFSGCRERESV